MISLMIGFLEYGLWLALAASGFWALHLRGMSDGDSQGWGLIINAFCALLAALGLALFKSVQCWIGKAPSLGPMPAWLLMALWVLVSLVAPVLFSALGNERLRAGLVLGGLMLWWAALTWLQWSSPTPRFAAPLLMGLVFLIGWWQTH